MITMNTPITFPPAEPALKLVRPSAEKWAATLAEERRRLAEDHDALREREKNLRDYETRLRALQAEIESVRPTPQGEPVVAARSMPVARTGGGTAAYDPALQLAWKKVHRAREILEAEQRNLRDERLAMREMDTRLKQREEAVSQREERLAEREAAVLAALPPEEPAVGEPALSAVTRLTRAPFMMARSVFGGKK